MVENPRADFLSIKNYRRRVLPDNPLQRRQSAVIGKHYSGTTTNLVPSATSVGAEYIPLSERMAAKRRQTTAVKRAEKLMG